MILWSVLYIEARCIAKACRRPAVLREQPSYQGLSNVSFFDSDSDDMARDILEIDHPCISCRPDDVNLWILHTGITSSLALLAPAYLSMSSNLGIYSIYEVWMTSDPVRKGLPLWNRVFLRITVAWFKALIILANSFQLPRYVMQIHCQIW